MSSRSRNVVNARKRHKQPLEDEYRKTLEEEHQLIPEGDNLSSENTESTSSKAEDESKMMSSRNIHQRAGREGLEKPIPSQRSQREIICSTNEKINNKETRDLPPMKKLPVQKDLLKPVDNKRNGRDSSSDDSSSHSGSEEHSTIRPDSKADSDESESIALDCHTGPSEVIVKGKNVRKIRVKFPPRPPEDASFEYKSLPSAGRFKRMPSALSLSSGQQPQEHGDDFEYQPLSQDGTTTKHFSYHNSLPSSLPDIQKMPSSVTSSFNSGSNNSSGGSSRSQPISTMSLDLGMQYGTYDWDSKVKHDILNGIEYFERKNAEMKDMNNRVLKELERITRLNHQIEDSLKLAGERNKMLSVENDELKIKNDQKEKETEKLKNDYMSQWNSRVKVEEMYMESKRTSEAEIKTLKEQIDAKNREIASLKEKHIHRKTSNDGHLNKSLKANMDEHLELLHKISRLEEEISKLKHEKERFMDSGKKNKDEVDGMKSKLKDQGSEIETQYKRFLSLKKSFNDLRDENDKLKLQLHVRGGKKNSAATAININNNTWPKNMPVDAKSDTSSEGVSYFGLPSKLGKAPVGKKVTKSPFSHKRAPSEGGFTGDNLPPVSNPVKP